MRDVLAGDISTSGGCHCRCRAVYTLILTWLRLAHPLCLFCHAASQELDNSWLRSSLAASNERYLQRQTAAESVHRTEASPSIYGSDG